MNDVIRPDIRQMRAYAVASVPEGMVKLDAMESPYEFSAALQQELAQALAQAPINRYPHVAQSGVAELIKEADAMNPAAEVVLGNGSDELIQLLTLLVAQSGATMLAPEPSFVMYRHNAQLFHLNYQAVALNEDFSLDLPAFLAAIEAHQPAIIFVAYPNNPTGPRFEREQVKAIIAAAPGLVVIDEAYAAFATDSFIQQAGLERKLVVLRTLSKVGFAGLRMGYAAGHPDIMSELKKITPPYNMNQLTLAAVKFALTQLQFIEHSSRAVLHEREALRTALQGYDAIKVFDSEANFLTVRAPDAKALFEALKHAGLLVKNLHGAHPLLDNCLRLTIGLSENTRQYLAVFEQLYGAQHAPRHD